MKMLNNCIFIIIIIETILLIGREMCSLSANTNLCRKSNYINDIINNEPSGHGDTLGPHL